MGALLPPAVKWKIFFRRQAAVEAYLSEGDVVTTRIATSDGAIDRGSLRNVVASAP